MVELINHWRNAFAELEMKLGRSPSVDEMAAVMELPLRKAKVIRRVVRAISSGFQGDSRNENQGLDETIQDDRTARPEEVALSEEETARVMSLLEQLDPRETKVLTLRFGLYGDMPLTLKEIGRKLELTRERVRQIQRNGLKKLYEFMSEE